METVTKLVFFPVYFMGSVYFICSVLFLLDASFMMQIVPQRKAMLTQGEHKFIFAVNFFFSTPKVFSMTAATQQVN